MHRPPQASFVRTLLVFLLALTVQSLAALAQGQPTPGRSGTATGYVRDPAGGGVLSSARLAVEEPSQGKAARPNFLILLTDDQRYDDLGSSGNTIIQTPHIDSLAQRGVLFRNAFVTSSICMASRASYFTGRVERSHGCNFYYRRLAPEAWAQSYPVRLRAAGYRTGFIGKFGVVVEGQPGGLPASDFTVFHGYSGQGNYFPQGKGGPHLTRVDGDQAVQFLRQGAESAAPFCLAVSFFAPHDPMQPDPELRDLYRDVTLPVPPTVRFDELVGLPPAYGEAAWYPRYHRLIHQADLASRQRYILDRYRLITGVDQAVGRILAELRRLNLAENTVIVFSSDNGFHYGEHGLSTKFYLHENSVRVPLIVVDPRAASARAGAADDRLAANIDVAPTILDLAGVPVPALMQGRSLVPLLRGEDVPWRDAVFLENLAKERRPMCDGLRTSEWKYIVHFEHQPVQEELYRLTTDPDELTNLAGQPDYEPVRTELNARLQALRLQYSGVASGFPDWIFSQRENTTNWHGYRAEYLKLKAGRRD
jgi:arylsulfatase A-like enzyme